MRILISTLFIIAVSGCGSYRLRPGAAREAAEIWVMMDPYAKYKNQPEPVCVGVKDPATNLYKMQCQ
jgi:hypothetical protein